MSVVIDASATIALVYEEISSRDIGQLEKEILLSGAIVPQLWPLEIANVLVLNSRRGRHGMSEAKAYLQDLARQQIAVDSETGKRAWDTTVELAAQHKLTYYAAYLELAARLRAPLATLDKELVRAARDEGVQLFWS